MIIVQLLPAAPPPLHVPAARHVCVTAPNNTAPGVHVTLHTSLVLVPLQVATPLSGEGKAGQAADTPGSSSGNSAKLSHSDVRSVRMAASE